MESKSIDIKDIMSKEYYIVDCNNFTYFAKTVHVIGIIGSPDGLEYEIDVPHPFYLGEHRTMIPLVLEQFKTFTEAQKEAERLNNIPENKKRREDWIKITTSQDYLERLNECRRVSKYMEV